MLTAGLATSWFLHSLLFQVFACSYALLSLYISLGMEWSKMFDFPERKQGNGTDTEMKWRKFVFLHNGMLKVLLLPEVPLRFDNVQWL